MPSATTSSSPATSSSSARVRSRLAFQPAYSPVGLAAWVYALFQDVSDSDGDPERVFPLDAMLDDIMMYWLPNAGPSSARFYWEALPRPCPRAGCQRHP